MMCVRRNITHLGGYYEKLNSIASPLPGSFGRVRKLAAKGNDRRRMLDLGLIYGTEVEALRKSPSGDPVAYEIRGQLLPCVPRKHLKYS